MQKWLRHWFPLWYSRCSRWTLFNGRHTDRWSASVAPVLTPVQKYTRLRQSIYAGVSLSVLDKNQKNWKEWCLETNLCHKITKKRKSALKGDVCELYLSQPPGGDENFSGLSSALVVYYAKYTGQPRLQLFLRWSHIKCSSVISWGRNKT